MRHLTSITLGLMLTAIASTAGAQEPTPPGAPPGAPSDGAGAGIGVGGATADQPGAAAPAAEAPKPKPPPYSVPWKLRPAPPLNVILTDVQLAKYEDANGYGGLATVGTLLGSYKITPELAVLARIGAIQNTAPSAPNAPVTNSGAAFMNPVVGGFYGMKFDDFRLGLFLGVALPLGGGGGDEPGKFAQLARTQVYSRAAMDNAMFAVNDLVIFPGVGFAYIKNGFTVQAEVTILELLRMRADDATKPGYQPEKGKMNMTSGLHVGYFILPQLSIGAELHYQRWLNAPLAVQRALDTPDSACQSTPVGCRPRDLLRSAQDQMTVQIGPRFHIKLGEKIWTRPGIAYERGVDWPMSAANNNYHNIQFHIPVLF